ncbi:ABC transporter ATP-binding protein [Microbulbifer sp. 2205BS26-8]|uniref:ABC transporter ATP-binding protein n=1 Tax=Microbulbifer sp. 2205BS26-8 TaxID=3064386 RepID=UPI00273F3F27|nr:ABC transporter ATP-binding protein [Microbulbifer sp. 2205BS26-8]MDP5210783.1 ABC transporter ATP-binding protein [Microbulbifer sp. 2205BS26-8]
MNQTPAIDHEAPTTPTGESAPAVSAVTLRNVSKDYQRGKITVPVLRNFDLEVGEGEFVAFMGASGSGKSTLLNLIGGLDRASAGSIEVAGENIGRFDRAQLARWRARSVGFIFQFYNLLPALTAAQNVELPLLIHSLPASERARRVANALQLMDLTHRAQHKPSELSGGQQQRVAIARALITDPKVLMCDEPTGDLDRESGENIMEILHRLNRQRGKTVLMATHDRDSAESAHRIVHFTKPDYR